MSTSSSVRGFLWHFQFVLTRTFRRICSALIGHNNSHLRIGEFVSPVQIVFEPLRVHRIIFHPCGSPGSTFLRVRLSDHQATPAAKRRYKFRHHLLRDVTVSAVLFVPGSRRCWFGLNFRVHHRKVSGRCSRVGIYVHASVLHIRRISEYSQQHFTVPAFVFVSSPKAAVRRHRCIVAHDVFSRSRVETEPATVHPVHIEFLLWSSCP